MTVTNQTVVYAYPADGVTATFPYPQAFIAQTDLRVRLLDVSGRAIAPPPVLNGGATYDYHVTGTPAADTGAYPSGGAVVFNNAPVPGPIVTVEITRIVPLVQPVALIDDAAMPAAAINLELDRLTMITQQLNAGIVTASGGTPPPATPAAAGLVPVVLPDGSGYEMREALLIGADPTAFDATGERIQNLGDAIDPDDAVTKNYVDAGAASLVSYIDAGDTAAKNHADAGDVATLTAANNHADAGDVAVKGYADAGDAATLTSAKAYTDAEIAGTGQVPPPLAGDVDSPLTATGAGAYQWKKPLSAQALSLGTRLRANGAVLNALGPTTVINAPAGGAVNPAIDGALNSYGGVGANHEWDLPAATAGAVIGIQLPDATHSCTIRPAGSDTIAVPVAHAYSNAAPLVIPATPSGTYATLFLVGRAGAWDVLAMAPEIAAALGIVSCPYFRGTVPGSNLGIPAVTNSKINLTMQLDSHGWWDAANHRYVPKRPGKYAVVWAPHLGCSSNQMRTGQTLVYKNGATVQFATMQWNSASYLPAYCPLPVSTIVDMNGTTDYIEGWVYIDATTPIAVGNNICEMNIRYLAP